MRTGKCKAKRNKIGSARSGDMDIGRDPWYIGQCESLWLFSFAPIKTAQVLENHSGGRASGKKVRDPEWRKVSEKEGGGKIRQF